MTKKDFELIAEAIYQADISWEATDVVAKEFAERLEKQNPRFDKEKFIKDCGGE